VYRPDKRRDKVPGIVLTLLWSMATSGGVPAWAQESNLSEYQVKAAFLYTFTKFVDWPEEPSGEVQANSAICVIGDDPFGEYLDTLVQGKQLNGRPIIVKRMKRGESGRSCRIVFISSSEKGHLRPILDSLRGSSALTVGDMENFARSGGMVNLVVEGKHVQFEINVDAAKRAGLTISSKLLGLAKIVHGDGSG
jgi:hypothetical protein